MSSGNCECQGQGQPIGGSGLYEVNNVDSDGRIRGSNDPRTIPDPTPRLPRNINIRPLNYGFVVTVGCQEFAVEDSKKMLELIGKYYENPYEMEEKWMTKREF